MLRAGFIHDNAGLLGVIFIAAVVLLFWFGTSIIIRRIAKKKDQKVLSNPALWLLFASSLVISLPGALLVQLLAKPVEPKTLTKEFIPTTLLVLYPLSLLLALIGVIL